MEEWDLLFSRIIYFLNFCLFNSEIIVEELKKSKNILGFIKSDGIYKITVKSNGIKKEIKEKADKLISLMGLTLSTEVISEEKNIFRVNINGANLT